MTFAVPNDRAKRRGGKASPRSQNVTPRPLERTVGRWGRRRRRGCMAFFFATYRFGAIRLTPVAHHGPVNLLFYLLMLRNAVRCNPQGAIAPLPSKCATASGKIRSGPSNCQLGHCLATHHLRIYVASLRRCVRPSFAFLAMRHVIKWAKIFCLTQRRSDATLRA